MNSTLTTLPCRVRADAEFTAVPLRSAIRPRLPSTTGCGNPRPGSPGHAHWLPDSMPAPAMTVKPSDLCPPARPARRRPGSASRWPRHPPHRNSQPLSPEIRPFPEPCWRFLAHGSPVPTSGWWLWPVRRGCPDGIAGRPHDISWAGGGALRRRRANGVWAVGHPAAEAPATAALPWQPMSPIEGDALCNSSNRDCKKSVRGESLVGGSTGCP